MNELSINLKWELLDEDFRPGTYSVDHIITVNNDLSLPASSAPDYGGNKNNLNPEQGLAAAMSSCHMMTFLALAAKMKWPVLNYSDKAIAFLGKNSKGKMSVTKIELNPKITFKDNFEVSQNEMTKMQDRSHRYCFIANALSEEVEVNINI
jgi:organic hydroperoxide reductase OsmC/OhrA